MKNNNLPRLTLKTAQTLAAMELGTTKGLKREADTPPKIYVYKMNIGTMQITIDNCCKKNGRFCLTHSIGGQRIRTYFDPITLNEDFIESFKEQERDRREEFEERVCEIGIEGCQKIIEKDAYRYK